METRKLMAFGQSSFIISLPKGWVRKSGLKKGDSIFLDERPDELAIYAGMAKEKSSEIEIKVNGKQETELKTEIISAYVNNYDVISILGDVRELKRAKAVIRSLAGMEVIEENSSKIVAKEMLDMEDVSLVDLVRRMDIIIRGMLGDLLVLKKDLTGSIYERDSEVNRLSLLSFRTTREAMETPALLKLFGMSYWNATITREVTMRLERLADQVKRLAKLVEAGAVKEKGKRKEFSQIYSSVVSLYERVMKLYYGKNRNEAYRMEGDSKALLKACDDYMNKYKTASSVKMMELIKHMIVATNGILRDTMENE